MLAIVLVVVFAGVEKVTPTLLRTSADEGTALVHLSVEASRASILDVLTGSSSDGSVIFDEGSVSSQAVIALGRSPILSGLSQKDRRTAQSGVPIQSSIPILDYVLSSESTTESNAAVIILLTPRVPACWDAQNRKAEDEFLELRRAFVQATRGTDEDRRRFRERYPHADDLPPTCTIKGHLIRRAADQTRIRSIVTADAPHQRTRRAPKFMPVFTAVRPGRRRCGRRLRRIGCETTLRSTCFASCARCSCCPGRAP